MNERLNYLYTDQQSILIDPQQEAVHSININRLNYIISFISVYVNYSNNCPATNNQRLLLNPESHLFSNANWFYLFSSALLLDQNYSSHEDNLDDQDFFQSIRSEFENIFYSNRASFMTQFLKFLVEQNQIQFLFEQSDKFGLLQLNHFSFLLTRFVDMAMAKYTDCVTLLEALNQFSQFLIANIVRLRYF